MSGVAASLLPGINTVLGVRDSIGAQLHLVYRLTRTWSGVQVGDGYAKDVKAQVLPSPQIVEYAHDLRLVEGGAVKQGDILLKQISKASYPEEDQVDGSTPALNIERFYFIDDRIYTVINVRERHLTWEVQVRKLSNQTLYL